MLNITKQILLNCFANEQLTATTSKQPESKYMPAGVLIPIIDDATELKVLFTERTAHLKNHAGQISFPGGRMESGDRDLISTTLRETFEEISLPEKQIQLIGQLPALMSSSGFLVTAFVGFIQGELNLKIDPFEVASTFTVPLNFLLNPANLVTEEIIFKGKPRKIHVIQFEQHRIWGLTAAVLVKLSEKINNLIINE